MAEQQVHTLTPHALRDWELPGAGGSKRSRGQVLVAGGDRSTPGAVMLAGLAALRVGAGVLQLAVAQAVATAVAVAVPEAAVLGLPDLDRDIGAGADFGALRDAVAGADAVLLGPGLADADHATALLESVQGALRDGAAAVLDAYALGVLPGTDLLRGLGDRVVLTPNSAEAARLLEVDDDDLGADDEVSGAIARRYAVTVSYSGTIASGDRLWRNESGHSGLGTSGSGDVLAGAVVGLLARGADAAQAACWATYLHSAAGDRLAPRVGRLGFLARELVDELPHVLVQAEA